MRKEWIELGNYYLQTKCPYMRTMPNGFRIPCGHCYYCRKKMANELAFRCEQEAFDQYVYNILITYDDEHIPFIQTPDGIRMTLNKVHFQDFMKRFRYHVQENFGVKLRYLCVGEYGGKKGRPHYHMILFSPIEFLSYENDIDDMGRHVPFEFITRLLNKSWNKGECDIEPMNNVSGSVKYLVQYLLSYKDERTHIEKPFKLMSRGRGLGFKWLHRNEDFTRYAVLNNRHYLNNGNFVISIPRYYQKKYLPEIERIARADDYYFSGKEYEFYLTNLFEYHEERSKFVDELNIYRERERITATTAYRKAKVHEHGRSASRVFAKRAKARKG